MKRLVAAILWAPIVLVLSVFLWAAWVEMLTMIQPDDLTQLMAIALRAAARAGR